MQFAYIFELTQVDVIPRVDKFNTAIRIGADETVDDVRAKERVDVGRLEFTIPVSVDSPTAEVTHGPLYAKQLNIWDAFHETSKGFYYTLGGGVGEGRKTDAQQKQLHFVEMFDLNWIQMLPVRVFYPETRTSELVADWRTYFDCALNWGRKRHFLLQLLRTMQSECS